MTKTTPAVLLTGMLGVLTGCSSADEDQPSTSAATASETATASPAAGDTVGGAVAEQAGTVGGSGSACELPVTFGLAEAWEPEPFDTEAFGGETFDIGPVTFACEIDAKPAGHIGFLRVWTGDPSSDDSPRDVLQAYVEGWHFGATDATYREVTVGEFTGSEVEYVNTDETLDEQTQERAFAVTTPDGPVVVAFDVQDYDEAEALPAYELAKATMRGTGRSD